VITVSVGKEIEMSRAVVFDEIGGPEVLKIVEVEVGSPGPGEVRLRVEAFGVNRVDQMLRTGVYAYPAPLPGSRLGVEAAGVVDALGPGVHGLAVGAEVLVTDIPRMEVNGTYAEQLIVPADSVIHRPGGLDAVPAAALWVAYATAYGALVETAAVRPGDHVVITAPSSAVGLAAIQLANQLGAVPIAVTRGAEKADALVKAGARHVVVSGEQNVPSAVRELTGGIGADVIIDAVAGPGLRELATAARPNGTVVMLGWLDTRPALLPMNWPLTIKGYSSHEHTTDPDTVGRIIAFLDTGLRLGTITPTVAAVLDLDDIVEAHRQQESNAHLGKIVVTT
jgi:NADPH:quinone reductase-like Zn-dependent oxidoreductase